MLAAAAIDHIDAKYFHVERAKIRDVEFVAKMPLARDGHGQGRNRNLNVDRLNQRGPRSIGHDKRPQQYRDEWKDQVRRAASHGIAPCAAMRVSRAIIGAAALYLRMNRRGVLPVRRAEAGAVSRFETDECWNPDRIAGGSGFS
ncbi:hypothetical protein GCM10011488_42410 [Steroidobacter agaridevorans]|nr:hypothetical protein GCM10011488_42410 [Steroidobacter agaridevorans]